MLSPLAMLSLVSCACDFASRAGLQAMQAEKLLFPTIRSHVQWYLNKIYQLAGEIGRGGPIIIKCGPQEVLGFLRLRFS